MKNINVQLGEIPVNASDTDEVLEGKAQRYLPEALRHLGEAAGEEAWNELKRQLGLKGTSSEKSKFIRDFSSDYAWKASVGDKKQVIEAIVEQLKEQRDTKAKKEL